MSRKLIWGLWMSVWPAVALVTPVVTAQSLRSGEEPAGVQSVATPAPEDPRPDSTTSPGTETRTESALERPQPAQRTSSESLPDHSKTGRRLDRSTPAPVQPQSDAAAFERSEPLPEIRDAPTARPSRTGVRSNTVRRTGPELTAREEQAQKLIYERAMLRSQQRHARLEARLWEKQGKLPPGKSPAWQPHLTQSH